MRLTRSGIRPRNILFALLCCLTLASLAVSQAPQPGPQPGAQTQVTQAPLPTPKLAYTRWKLIQIGGIPVTPADYQHDPFIILQSQSHRLTGSGGCNRLTGSYSLEDTDTIVFSGLASTRMACAKGMDLEQKFTDNLEQVKTWKIDGQQLDLLSGDGSPMARFQAQPPPVPKSAPPQ